MSYQSLSIHHTPSAFKLADGKTYLLSSAGNSDRALDIWLVSEEQEPIKLISYAALGFKSVCSPWIIEKEHSVELYCTTHNHVDLLYSISRFEASSILGPFVLREEKFVEGFITADSPAFLGDTLYFTGIKEAGHWNSLWKREGSVITPIDLPENPAFRRHLVMKPNIFSVAEEELALFILDVDGSGKYHTSVFDKKAGEEFKFVAEYKSGEESLYYKPFLYKGHLISVLRTSVDQTRLYIAKIKLSGVWEGFTDYPKDFTFPFMNLGE